MKLPFTFFQQETTKTAVELLGQTLVRVTKKGTVFKGRIVETEAYLGLEDSSCHSFGGRRTNRTKTMYLQGGHAYVYFTYGMHYCFNVVTGGQDQPEAVLIRAVQPLKGIEEMMINRKLEDTFNLTNGPAKLCQAMKIDKSLNGESLMGNSIYVENGKAISFQEMAVDKRVGLSLYSDSYYWPLRFYIKNNPYVSVKNKNYL
ncbi:MAG: DNA-3-methyladenine glycosylase [Bdellovibrionales bacterium]|nr:DNA-3-methyladenine glycosylase [Bdellovibrionales bacterium]